MLNSLYPWMYFDMATEGGGGGDSEGDSGSDSDSDSGGQQSQDQQTTSEGSQSNPGTNPLIYQKKGNPYASPARYAAQQNQLRPLPPPSNPRHHVISTYRDPVSEEAFVWINETAVTYGGLSPVAGFDFVVSIEDVTTGGLPVNPLAVSNSLPVPRKGLKYNSSNSPQVVGNSPYAQQRTIKVTWASGFTKNFEMLVPGTEQAGGQYVQAGATVDDGVIGYGPVSPGDYDWRGGLKYVSSVSQSNTKIVFSKTRELQDPASVYRNGESVYQVSATGSNVIFNINTSDNTSGAISAGSGCTGGHLAMASYGDPDRRAIPDKVTLPEQTFETIVISYLQRGFGSGPGGGLSAAANIGLYNMGLDLDTLSNVIFNTENVTWNNLHSGLQIHSGMNIVNEPFSHTITYSENLWTPVITSTNIDVCDDASSANYYLTTCKDCDGNTIPGCPNNISNTIQLNSSQCCSPCQGTLNFGTHFDQCVTYGVNDGIFRVMIDTTAAGTPWPSGSLYTWTITHSLGTASFTQTAPPTGGNDFDVSCTTNVTSTTEHQVTSTSSTRIATGMIVTGTGIPTASTVYVGEILTPAQPAATIGVTKFELVNSSGAIVSAISAATSTLTFAAGTTMVWRALQPNTGVGGIGGYYTFTVLDYDGCDYSSNFTLCQGYPTTDCLDNQAINYNSAANLGCTSCCIYCNLNGLGQLSNQNSGYVGDLFDSTSTTNTQIATDTSTSDGGLQANASIINSIIPELDLDGTQDYTMTLYKTSTYGGSISGLSATATATGLALNGTSPSKLFTGLAYGYYAIKVQLVDSSSGTQALETCYTVFYGKVQVYVCDDPTTTTYNTTVPVDLRISDPSLCTISQDCCTLLNLIHDYVGCDTTFYVTLACDPRADTVVGYWTKDGVTIPSSGFTYTNVYLGFLITGPVATGVGLYEVIITSTYTNGFICTSDASITLTAQDFKICDCLDPIALNYNIIANADCVGSFGGTNFSCCIYCIYGCQDPNASNYDPNATCPCEECCIYDVYGCTDPCAVNYNGAATIDDQSCVYSACLDQAASNYLYSCRCNHNVPSATHPDVECCLYPCGQAGSGQVNAVLTITTTDATGTCTVPLADGTASVAVVINNGAPTWTIYYTDNAGVTLYTDPVIYAGNTTAATWTGLANGVYKAIVIDGLGCETEEIFSIGIDVDIVGCMDPFASNYNPNATCDCECCIICGCMDPTALNYNPIAVCDDGSCVYPAQRRHDCIPATIEYTLARIELCLVRKGSEFLHDLTIGINEDCITMNKWKLILIAYLLNRQDTGLDCLFNCGDEETPDGPETCATKWITGGPVTGINDQAHAGSSISTGEGTTITDSSLYFVSTNTVFQGDVLKMPNGIFWTFHTPTTTGRQANENPPFINAPQPNKGYWVICNPIYDMIIPNTTNYIDNFINFVNEFCVECDIDHVVKTPEIPPPIPREDSPELRYTQNNINFNI